MIIVRSSDGSANNTSASTPWKFRGRLIVQEVLRHLHTLHGRELVCAPGVGLAATSALLGVPIHVADAASSPHFDAVADARHRDGALTRARPRRGRHGDAIGSDRELRQPRVQDA